MKNYKSAFYEKYVTTHIADRKGTATIDEFKIRAKIYQKVFGKLLPSDKTAKILDIGCGNGSVVWWLQRAGYSNASGIDISIEQIEVGRNLGVRNIDHVDLVEFMSCNKNTYDAIIFRDVIEHFHKKEIINILSLCKDSLMANGLIILQVPNAESPFFGRIRYGDFTHEVAFTSTSLHQLLKMTGYDQVKCYPTDPKATGIKSSLRVLAWVFIEKLYKLALFAELGTSQFERIVTQNIIVAATKKSQGDV